MKPRNLFILLIPFILLACEKEFSSARTDQSPRLIQKVFYQRDVPYSTLNYSYNADGYITRMEETFELKYRINDGEELTNFSTRSSDFEYDSNNKLLRRKMKGSAGGESWCTFEYDSKNRLKRMIYHDPSDDLKPFIPSSDPSDSLYEPYRIYQLLEYDSQNRLKEQRDSLYGKVYQKYLFEYNSTGNMSAYTLYNLTRSC